MIGRRGNGAAASSANLDADLAKLEAEIIAVERAGEPLAQREAALEQEMATAIAAFEQFGFARLGVTPEERAGFDRRMLIGALGVIGGDQLLDVTKARLRRDFAAQGGVGYSAAEKRARLNQLQRQRRRLLAHLEQHWRTQDAAGELVGDPRRALLPELFLLGDDELSKLANGQTEEVQA